MSRVEGTITTDDMQEIAIKLASVENLLGSPQTQAAEARRRRGDAGGGGYRDHRLRPDRDGNNIFNPQNHSNGGDPLYTPWIPPVIAGPHGLRPRAAHQERRTSPLKSPSTSGPQRQPLRAGELAAQAADSAPPSQAVRLSGAGSGKAASARFWRPCVRADDVRRGDRHDDGHSGSPRRSPAPSRRRAARRARLRPAVVACDSTVTAASGRPSRSPTSGCTSTRPIVARPGARGPRELPRHDVGRRRDASRRAPPDGSKPLSLWLSSSPARRHRARAPRSPTATPCGASTRAAGPRSLVYAPDAADLAAGAYALLEELGARFFHPKQELVPAPRRPAPPAHARRLAPPVAATRAACSRTRCTPSSTSHVFMQPSDANLADAKRFVDWLVKTGQNYMQWPLLTTVDWSELAAVRHSHPRLRALARRAASARVPRGVGRVVAAEQLRPGERRRRSWQSRCGGARQAAHAAVGRRRARAGRVHQHRSRSRSSTGSTTRPTTSSRSTRRSLVNVQNHVGNYPHALGASTTAQTVFYYHLPGVLRLSASGRACTRSRSSTCTGTGPPTRTRTSTCSTTTCCRSSPTRRVELLPRVGVLDQRRHRRPRVPARDALRALARHPHALAGAPPTGPASARRPHHVHRPGTSGATG